MADHYSLSDKQFEKQFADCTLAPSFFNHEAHIRLAWIHINRYGEEMAIHNICKQIKKFDQVHGDSSKYHTTLTVAAIKTVFHFYTRSKSDSFKSFIAEFPRLNTNFKDLLESHYGFNLFKSVDAKNSYLKPDLLPYDN